MGGAKNWAKKYEKKSEICWSHQGAFGFKLRADKEKGKWKLKLTTSKWSDKHDKEIIETNTKKRVKSFAYDWRRTRTDSKELLKEAGIWIDNTRKILNPFNVSLVLMNFFLFLGLLQTWKFIEPTFGDTFLGLIMGAGGVIFVIEGFYTDDTLELTAPLHRPDEAVSLLTGAFAILSSYGYIYSSQFYITHFSGVQGGIFAFMCAYLTIHWLKNRMLKFIYLGIQWTKSKMFGLKKGFVDAIS